jgi:hypothetical protein
MKRMNILRGSITSAFLLVSILGRPQSDPEGLMENNFTPTWAEAIALFQDLADSIPEIHMTTIGQTDVGRPLHAVVAGPTDLSGQGLEAIQAAVSKHPNRLRILVNNAIHPGEPCGVDASLAHLRGLAAEPTRLKETIWIYIPMFNVGGGLQRNCCSRANQSGPAEYGFRGNARNLDLNRDFVKADSRNVQAFNALLTAFDPDIFVDTHTTNGADYQATMTLITTQPDKAGPILGPLIREVVNPYLYNSMAQKGDPMVPYVNSIRSIPDSGIVGFLETPRYSTGYAALQGTIGFVSEAHMLKPFPERVASTLRFLESIESLALEHSDEIRKAREEEKARCQNARELPVRWERTETADSVLFRGYKAEYMPSGITGGERLRYNQSQPWTDSIPFYDHFEPTHFASIPDAWILPQAWHEVHDRLALAGVKFRAIPQDTILTLDVTRITDFSAPRRPYEGHFPLTIREVQEAPEAVRLFAGDHVILASENPVRLCAELLDPMAHDAYLVWNFFDSALQQKEYYSAYVFEDEAQTLLNSNPDLRRNFRQALRNDSALRATPSAQIQWLYEHSHHFEGAGGVVNLYPVYKAPTWPITD